MRKVKGNISYVWDSAKLSVFCDGKQCRAFSARHKVRTVSFCCPAQLMPVQRVPSDPLLSVLWSFKGRSDSDMQICEAAQL